MIRRIALTLALICAATLARAACSTLPFTLTAGTLASAAQVMANFNAINTCVNAPLTLFGLITANTVLSGPTTAGPSAPTFRNLIAADFGVSISPNNFLVGPASGGAAAATFRTVSALALSDTVAQASWSPTDQSGAGLTFVSPSATGMKLYTLAFVFFEVTFPANASGAQAAIGGLPFVATTGANYAKVCNLAYTNTLNVSWAQMSPGTSTVFLWNQDGSAAVNSQLSGKQVNLACVYPTA